MNTHLQDELIKILHDISNENFSYSLQRSGIINLWGENIEQFVELFYRLNDDNSKKIFIKLLRYNFASYLCENSDKYSLYTKKEWTEFEEKAKKVCHVEGDYILDRIETFIIEGYSYNSNICPKNGDYIFDCGAYTGNTALYFSQKSGLEGNVFAFEAMPETYNILKRNMSELGNKNINIYNNAISNCSKKLNFTVNATPGSRQTNDKNGIEVQAISIDEFVKNNNIHRVDFIKMDIEGSELEALEGCKLVCKKHDPILAICIYHKISDFIDIPRKILDIDSRYRFYLKHSSRGFHETVLFAIKDNEPFNYTSNNIEIENIKRIWKTLQNIHRNNHWHTRKNLLLGYHSKLKSICSIALYPEFEKKNYSYLYYPLSDDNRLHYEFLFAGEKVNIALHFEGKWIDVGKKLINNIIDICDIDLCNDSNSSRSSVSFTVSDIYNIDNIAYLMKCLIESSYDILRANKLLSVRSYYQIQ